MARVKKKDHENLSDTNINKVIELLEAEKPITKKTACEILNISYNTTRLASIIEGHEKRLANIKKHKDANRGKPASEYEIGVVVESYLKGESVASISSSIYRSSSFVNNIITKLGIPKKVMGDDKRYPAILPDNCVSETFEIDQIAWSAVYHAPCKVIKEISSTDSTNYEEKYGCKCYSIYVIEPLEELIDVYPNIKTGGFYASSTAFNLGTLEHLFKYGIKIDV